MQKIAFVDWDDVLFDLPSFKTAYFNFLAGRIQTSSVKAHQIVFKSYEEAKGKGWYDPDEHIDALQRLTGHVQPRGEILFGIECFIARAAAIHVYFDAEWFLKSLSNSGYEIYFVTLGTRWFQEAKIKHSGIENYGSVVVTQDPTKVSAIEELCSLHNYRFDQAILFDDSRRVVESAREAFPEMKIVQVLRGDAPDKKTKKPGIAVIKDLCEVIIPRLLPQ